MIRCVCFVQENQTPDQNRTSLIRALNAFTESAFNEPADISWIPVAKGNGFTAGQPSSSSVVSVTAPGSLEQKQRVSLLNALCDLWMAETGCSLNEIVAVVNDPRPA